MSVKVAAIQFAPVLGQVSINLMRMVELGVEAARNGAEMLVFPELATTGYSHMSVADARQCSECLRGPQATTSRALATMRALATKYRVYVVWGCIEHDPETDQCYNAQVCISPTGETALNRKINLWGNDFLWATEGTRNPPIIRAECRDGTSRRVGLLICRDVRDKKDKTWPNFYSRGDADVVAFSANWGNGGFPAVQWMNFVKHNGTALIVANRYGKESHNDFGEGGSCIVTANGKVHCEGLAWGKDCIIYADV